MMELRVPLHSPFRTSAWVPAELTWWPDNLSRTAASRSAAQELPNKRTVHSLLTSAWEIPPERLKQFPLGPVLVAAQRLELPSDPTRTPNTLISLCSACYMSSLSQSLLVTATHYATPSYQLHVTSFLFCTNALHQHPVLFSLCLHLISKLQLEDNIKIKTKVSIQDSG
jgi:hypothetical protein